MNNLHPYIIKKVAYRYRNESHRKDVRPDGKVRQPLDVSSHDVCRPRHDVRPGAEAKGKIEIVVMKRRLTKNQSP
jgi:hypothetical protein